MRNIFLSSSTTAIMGPKYAFLSKIKIGQASQGVSRKFLIGIWAREGEAEKEE